MRQEIESWLNTAPLAAATPQPMPRRLYARLKLLADLLRRAPPSPSGPRLLWRNVSDQVVSLALSHPLVLGRDGQCDLAFADTRLSRRHCEFRADADGGSGWELIDLDSTNGTHVNGRPVERHILRDGDLIEVGGQCLAFVCGTD